MSESRRPACFLAPFAKGACWGPTDRAHLIPKQVIKRQFPFGAMRRVDTGEVCAQRRNEDFAALGVTWEPVAMKHVIWDDRVWVHACRRHHGDFDNYRIRLWRADLPQSVFEFAAQYGLSWRLERDFPGPVTDLTDVGYAA